LIVDDERTVAKAFREGRRAATAKKAITVAGAPNTSKYFGRNGFQRFSPSASRASRERDGDDVSFKGERVADRGKEGHDCSLGFAGGSRDPELVRFV